MSFKVNFSRFLLGLVFWLCFRPCAAQTTTPLAAFPGAVGFGAGATGGRGGSVYHVTSLHDSGPGTFRDAVSHGHRLVVFDTGGYISLKSPVSIHSDLTIAGQTAPGDGVGVLGQGISLSRTHNVIIRYMRFRQGLSGGRGKSAINIHDGSDIIFDHVSVSWGRWDTIDITGGSDMTFQNCLIGPGINPQRFGCLCQSDNITFTRCLWIDNQSRNPKAKGHIQYINNVIYNWGVGGLVGGHSSEEHDLDVIANYFIQGPSSRSQFTSEYTSTDHVFQTSNLADLDRDGKLSGRPVLPEDFGTAPKAPTFVLVPFLSPPYPVPVETPQQAYADVLTGVGDSRPRDSVDGELLDELASLGTRGTTIHDPKEMGGPGRLKRGHALLDTDGDGIPDVWELRHRLDPNNPADANGDYDQSGYTNIEKYLNSLADGTAWN